MNSLRVVLREAVLLVGVLGLTLAASASAQDLNRAAVVVSLGNDQVITRCVEFAEEQISGYDLLARTGLELETDIIGLGASVCRIEGSGCPADDCFCQCKGGGSCIYWSYWHQQEGIWTYSQVGAAMYHVQDGAVDGWVWDVGSPNQAPAPPAVTFDEVCASPSVQAMSATPQASEDGVESTDIADVFTEMNRRPSEDGDSGARSSASLVWSAGLGLAVLGGVLLVALNRRKRT